MLASRSWLGIESIKNCSTWKMSLVMLVSQRRVQFFLAYAQHEAYLAGIDHRTAAIEDSLLLPLSELPLEGAD